jgi:MFS family permease
MRPSTWPLILLAIILAAGSYVRLAHLERGDFRDDELFQYYVAESLERGEGPLLPSGRTYLRGIDVTHMVRVSIRHLGRTPTAIRLPSAVLGALGLFLFAAILWAMAGPWPAVWGTLLLAVYPEAVVQARQLRFYTYQMLFGLGALYTGWQALRTAGSGEEPDRTSLVRQWLWVGLTLGVLLMAVRVQLVSLSILAGWGVCAALAAAADLAARGRHAWRKSAPVQIVAIGILGLMAALVMRPGLVAWLLERSRIAPYWVVLGQRTDPLVFYASLRDDFPVLLAFLPVLFLGAILRKPRLGLYLTIWFAVPMLLHSFFFTWKELRFVLLAMPALFAAAGICAAWGAGALLGATEYTAGRWGVPPWLRRPAAHVVVVVTSLVMIGSLPALFTTRALVRADQERATKWTQSAAIIRARPDLAEVPAGTGYALHGLYYWPRLDFVVRVHGLERSTTRTTDGRWVIELNPMGSPEYKTGRPVLTTPEAIREHFAEVGAVLIAFDVRAGSSTNTYVEQSLYDTLSTEAEELCQGRCGAMRLYHWRFGASAEAGSASESPAVRRGGADEVSQGPPAYRPRASR